MVYMDRWNSDRGCICCKCKCSWWIRVNWECLMVVPSCRPADCNPPYQILWLLEKRIGNFQGKRIGLIYIWTSDQAQGNLTHEYIHDRWFDSLVSDTNWNVVNQGIFQVWLRLYDKWGQRCLLSSSKIIIFHLYPSFMVLFLLKKY